MSGARDSSDNQVTHQRRVVRDHATRITDRELHQTQPTYIASDARAAREKFDLEQVVTVAKRVGSASRDRHLRRIALRPWIRPDYVGRLSADDFALLYAG